MAPKPRSRSGGKHANNRHQNLEVSEGYTVPKDFIYLQKAIEHPLATLLPIVEYSLEKWSIMIAAT